MPMNSAFLHCMWSDRKNRLSLTHACEFVFICQGWISVGPVLDPCSTRVGRTLDPCWTRVDPCWTSGPVWTRVGPVLDREQFVDQWWSIFRILWIISELWSAFVGSFLDRIVFLGHFVIVLTSGIVCVIAVL